jgi:hypothetical protein
MIRSRSGRAETTKKPAKNRNRCHASKVTSRQPPRSSSAADAARAQRRPERGRDGQYASRISLRAKVDGRAAVESYNPSGASARLCEDPTLSQVADRDVRLLDDGSVSVWHAATLDQYPYDRARDELPCKSWVFRRQSWTGQATREARCAIASTREEEGARDDPLEPRRAASTRSSAHPRPPESHPGSSSGLSSSRALEPVDAARP